MTVEQMQAMIDKIDELAKQATEALMSLGPDRISDIDMELDNLYERI